MLTLLGAVVVLFAVSKVPVSRLVETRRRAVVRGLLGAATVLFAAGLLGLVAAVGNPVTWVTNQLASSGEVVNGPGRFGQLETNNRTVWWGEAWQVFRANPAGGTGASTFEIARKRVRSDAQNVSSPHSAPLQLLSETGLPGFLLGLTFVVGLALGIRATLRDSRTKSARPRSRSSHSRSHLAFTLSSISASTSSPSRRRRCSSQRRCSAPAGRRPRGRAGS